MATETYARHESQLRVLKLLDSFRAAVLRVPPQDRVNWFGHNSSIHVSLETMKAMFSGKPVRMTDEGIVTITVDGVTYAARRVKPTAPPTEFVL